MIVTLIFPSIIMPALQRFLPLSSVFSWRLFNFSDTMFYNTRCKVQTMVPIVQFDVNKFLLVENWEPRSESNFRLRREFADWKLTIYLSEVNFTRGGVIWRSRLSSCVNVRSLKRQVVWECVREMRLKTDVVF